MDLVLKGRGVRITDQVRRTAQHKLGKIGRLDPRVGRLEVEIIGERNRRLDGRHRVEVTCGLRKGVLRAQGEGTDLDSALDQAVDHLERQLSTYRGKLRNRRQGRAMV